MSAERNDRAILLCEAGFAQIMLFSLDYLCRHRIFCGGHHLLENRLNPKLVHRADETADVVAKDFAQDFVLHRDIRLAANRVAKLRFHHTESALDVRPLVVVLQELFAAQTEVVERLRKQATDSARGMAPERDVGLGLMLRNGLEVHFAGIRLVGRQLANREVLGGRVEKRRQKRAIVRVPVMDLNGGHDVGFDSADGMGFHGKTAQERR